MERITNDLGCVMDNLNWIVYYIDNQCRDFTDAMLCAVKDHSHQLVVAHHLHLADIFYEKGLLKGHRWSDAVKGLLYHDTIPLLLKMLRRAKVEPDIPWIDVLNFAINSRNIEVLKEAMDGFSTLSNTEIINVLQITYNTHQDELMKLIIEKFRKGRYDFTTEEVCSIIKLDENLLPDCYFFGDNKQIVFKAYLQLQKEQKVCDILKTYTYYPETFNFIMENAIQYNCPNVIETVVPLLPKDWLKYSDMANSYNQTNLSEKFRQIHVEQMLYGNIDSNQPTYYNQSTHKGYSRI